MQWVRKARGQDLKREQFQADLHYLYLVTAVRPPVPAPGSQPHGGPGAGGCSDAAAARKQERLEAQAEEAMRSAATLPLQVLPFDTACLQASVPLFLAPAPLQDTPVLGCCAGVPPALSFGWVLDHCWADDIHENRCRT